MVTAVPSPMVGPTLRHLPFDELVDEAEDEQSRESGTRHVARRATPPPPPELASAPRRDSQRPTIPVPGAASLVAYIESPPRIQHADLGRKPRVAMRAVTLSPQDERPTSAPPRGEYNEKNPVPAPALVPMLDAIAKVGTLRLHLTPYAREHAHPDGDTDDTPAEMLEYLKALGSVEHIPFVTASMKEILMATLDHREGFVLSLVDGRSDIDALLDASPMPTHKTLRILQGLRARNLIALREPTRRPA